MASIFDFSADIVYSPVVDRIHRGDRIRDDLPRRRNQNPETPDGKDSGDDSPEDIKTSNEIETEERRLDLRA